MKIIITELATIPAQGIEVGIRKTHSGKSIGERSIYFTLFLNSQST